MDGSSVTSLTTLCTSISTRAVSSLAETRKLVEGLDKADKHVLQFNFVSTALDQLRTHASQLEEALNAAAVISQRLRDALAQSMTSCEKVMAASHKQLTGLQPGTLGASDTSFLMTHSGFLIATGQLFVFFINVLKLGDMAQQEEKLGSPAGKQIIEHAETATRLIATSGNIQLDEDTANGSSPTKPVNEQVPVTNTADAPPTYLTSTNASTAPLNPVNGRERSKGSSFFRTISAAFRAKPDPFVSALCQAVKQGHERQVSDLISQGANINGRNENGNTPFKCAMKSDQAGAARLLLSAGAKASTSTLGLPPLFQAVFKGSFNVAKVLIEFGESVNSKAKSGMPHIFYPITEGKVAAVEFLISNGAEVNVKTLTGQFVIVVAVERDNVEMVRLLLDHGADVNATDITGCPLITVAYYKRSINMITLLLERGANPDARSRGGGTILYWAITNKDFEIAKQLLRNSADPAITDPHAQPILYLLIRHGLLKPDETVEMIRLLLDNGTDPDTIDVAFGSPVICHAVEMPNSRIVEELLCHGANTKVRMFTAQTLLTYSIDVNNREHVKVLLDYGAGINEVDGWNRTPLSIALSRVDYNLTKMLVEHGADPTARENQDSINFIKALKRNDFLELLGLAEGGQSSAARQERNIPRAPAPDAEMPADPEAPPPSYEVAAGKF
ncbi:hypothetical protein NW762_007666 [Fusarium torreyae]|uniref:Ankyrin repeat protein n=1 Tax=Fusarium torreyae TaxID=1237075 RepID=A0A9W8RYZ9_9HYPO|nr:hypothetical protein NW762_007666 [Fusarium torreyae]